MVLGRRHRSFSAFGDLSTDLPVIGDWNGDGTDEIGVWHPGPTARFFLDLNGNYTWDAGTDLGRDFGRAPICR